MISVVGGPGAAAPINTTQDRNDVSMLSQLRMNSGLLLEPADTNNNESCTDKSRIDRMKL